MALRAASSGKSDYDVRRYHHSDRTAVLDLYETVTGRDGTNWLSWKYEDNPYVDHVSMVVATTADRVVAAMPAVAFRLHVGDRAELALQPTDTMVHPEHRHRDLLDLLADHLRRVYADREPALFFDVRGESDRPIQADGWKEVDRLQTAYRIRHPSLLLDDDARRAARITARAFGSLQRLSHRLRDCSPDWTVTRSNHVPTRTLTGLARDHRPFGIHAVRDPRYLAWRFENPAWSYTTYLTGDDESRAALIAGERHVAGQHVVALTDVYPPAAEKRATAVEQLVRAVVADNPRADTILADETVLPRRVRRRTGFRCDSRWPLSWFGSPSTLVTAPASGPDPAPADWQVAGVDITDPENWHLSLAERSCW
ncbi:GNAT family N-acetyltransferase [Salinibaculum salinum]|uniref:GNAT family N-acetyltransferase n=1 Tax=Salinibaculum salinum TaxID=3131996 RepID=UPI0030ED7A71